MNAAIFSIHDKHAYKYKYICSSGLTWIFNIMAKFFTFFSLCSRFKLVLWASVKKVVFICKIFSASTHKRGAHKSGRTHGCVSVRTISVANEKIIISICVLLSYVYVREQHVILHNNTGFTIYFCLSTTQQRTTAKTTHTHTEDKFICGCRRLQTKMR